MAADWRTASVERDDDLPCLDLAALDECERLEGLVERECCVEDRAQMARVVEGGELAELGTIGPHEEERVTHTELLRGPADLAAQERQHELERLWRVQLFCESGIGWAGDPDCQAAGFEDGERFHQVLAAERVQHEVIARENLGEILFRVVDDDV